MHCMRRGSHPPYPPFARGGKSYPPFARGGKSYPPFARGGKSYPPFARGGKSYPPFARGGKSAASGLFSPLAKGGHRGVLRVPRRCARFGIQAIEKRSRSSRRSEFRPSQAPRGRRRRRLGATHRMIVCINIGGLHPPDDSTPSSPHGGPTRHGSSDCVAGF